MSATPNNSTCIRCGGAAITVQFLSPGGRPSTHCSACGQSPKDCYCQIRPVEQPAAAQHVPVGISARVSRLQELHDALLDSAALEHLPDPEPVIDGLLYRDSLAYLGGKPGSGKSLIAVDWAGCVSTGLPWQMHGVTTGPVLYVIAEGITGLRQRVRAREDHAATKTGVMFLPVAVQLADPVEVAALALLAADLEPVLVVVDTQGRVSVGMEENSARDMGELVAALDRIRAACQACVLVVHHQPRTGENLRGSTALEGAATTILSVEKDGMRLMLTMTKQKDGPESEPISLQLVPRLDSVTVQSPGPSGLDYSDSERQVLAALDEIFGAAGASTTKLLEVTGMAKTSCYRAVNQLSRRGEILNGGTGKRPIWVLPRFAADPLTEKSHDSH